MSKENLKKELLEKVKEGVKPSDIKRMKQNQSQNKPKEKNIIPSIPIREQLLTPPSTPPLKPSKGDILPPPIVQSIPTPPESPVLRPQKASPVPPISTNTEQATMCPKSPNKNPTKTPIKDTIPVAPPLPKNTGLEKTVRELEEKNKELNKTIQT